MCGILGVINTKENELISSDLLNYMSDSMAHRGPDAEGIWIQDDKQCGLAHKRLSILDLSAAANQPMSILEGSLQLVFNGEIYNFKELRETLKAKGHKFRSESDTEVILYLYLEYGDDFYLKLDGDFALGLWDKSQQKLILARDQAGVKPLYYSFVDGVFVFASEIRAILRHPKVVLEIDPESFYHYLTFLAAPPPRTLIRNVFKIPSASTLLLRKGRTPLFEVKKYWLPVPSLDFKASYEDLDEEFESLFSKSVKKRLLSDVPVGLLFSGGVDSSLNLKYFSDQMTCEIPKTFTIGLESETGANDETLWAKKIANHIGSEHHEVKIDAEDFLASSKYLSGMQDDPIADPVCVPLYHVTKLAKENGVTVLQAGEGADELFCGYSNYQSYLGRYSHFWNALNKIPDPFLHFAKSGLGFIKNPKASKLSDMISRNLNQKPLFVSSAVGFFESEKTSVLNEHFLSFAAKEFDSTKISEEYNVEFDEICPGGTLLQRITFTELQLRLPELLLMRTDKMSMANSVETRVPFLDRDIMNFSLRVPDDYKFRGGVLKDPVKRLAAKNLPRDFVYRQKKGFGVPVNEWLVGTFWDSMKDLVDSDPLDIGSFVNANGILDMGKNSKLSINQGFQIWTIYNLYLWADSLTQG